MVPPSELVQRTVSTLPSCTWSVAIHGLAFVNRTGAAYPLPCRLTAHKSEDDVPVLFEKTHVLLSCDSSNAPLTPGIGARVVVSSPLATSTPKSSVRVPFPVDQ